MGKFSVKVPTRTQKADPYYSEVGKHYTPYDWTDIDMSKLDLGFHIDPTPKGVQAKDRKLHHDTYKTNPGGGETKDLRFRVGNSLVARDIGWWDVPKDAALGIQDALYDVDLDLASRFEQSVRPQSLTKTSTMKGDPTAAADMQKVRQWLLDEGYDTVQYKNTSEGADFAAEDALLDPEWLDYERDMLVDIEGARYDYNNGDEAAGERLIELEDELEYARDEALNQAAEENISYIALDPGNVRSANAKFDPKNYGKPGMMLSNAATLLPAGTLAALSTLGSSDTAAADLPAGILDVASRTGEMLVNDALQGSQSLSNAIYDTRDAAPQVQFAPRTEAGDALSEGILSDLGDVINYRGLGGNMPSIGDAIQGGIDLYNEYVSPYLSERQEMGLGGALLAASTLFPGGKAGTKNIQYGTEATRLGKQTPAASKRSLENQAARVREDLASQGDYETVVEDAVDLQSLPVLSRSDLEGGVLMPTAGDMTLRAPRMTRASGIDVDTDLQGGPGYGAEFGEWESTEDVAQSYQDKVRQVAEVTGRDKVFGTYSPMRLPSASFSTMPAEVAMQQIGTLLDAGANFDPAMVRQIDDIVRRSGNKKTRNPDFPGILSPDAQEYLSQKGPATVAARKAMLNEMSKAPYRDAGFPLVDQIYRDVSYPELHGRHTGETGDLILRLDPSQDVRHDSTHRSYGSIIPGQGAGRLGGTAQFRHIYRDAWDDLQGAMTTPKEKKGKPGEWTTPRPLNNLEKVNTVNWNKPRSEDAKTSGYQLVDEQLLDELERLGLLAP